jgi:uncharacterized protein (DUF952 family)
MSDITYHLVAAEYYRDANRTQPYTPEAFAADGFIHCTDGSDHVAEVGNLHYRQDRRMYVALVIDKTKVVPSIVYEDAARLYPHIYGPLNRDAIVEVVPLLRAQDGAFLPPKPSRS